MYNMRMKKLKKEYIATALIFTAAILFCGCETGKIGGKGSTQMSSVNDNNTKKENQNISNADMYEYVLAEYSDMVRNNFYVEFRDSDIYESSFGKEIGLEIRTHEQDIYYTFYDIDGNGITELIIAGGENSVSDPVFSPWNYDLYGYNGTKAVHIFPEMNFGYRTNFSFYENGVIEVFYSNSASESGVDFYKIGNDGFTPELIDSFTMVGRLEKESPVFTYLKNGNEITEEEYNADIQKYKVPLKTVLDWTQIQ